MLDRTPGRAAVPRIAASTIDEHVRLQTARILDAAGRLFRERGYRRTDMDDIAAAVGLARNSLYRYYRNKDYILLALVERDMGEFVFRLRDLAKRYPDPRERLGVWLDMQLDMATGPTHATLEMIAEIRSDAPDLRRRLLELHTAPGVVIEQAVAQALRGRRRDVGLTVALINGMVGAAAAEAMARDRGTAVRRELRRAVLAVVGG